MTTTVNLNKVNFMSESRFDEMGTTDNTELYMVENTVKICEVVFWGVTGNKAYSQNLPTPLPNDLTKVFCNAYMVFKSAAAGYAIGDVVPWSDVWGTNYRALTSWYNTTQCGFGTSDQITVLNKNTSNTATNVSSASLEVHFDFYKME